MATEYFVEIPQPYQQPSIQHTRSPTTGIESFPLPGSLHCIKIHHQQLHRPLCCAGICTARRMYCDPPNLNKFGVVGTTTKAATTQRALTLTPTAIVDGSPPQTRSSKCGILMGNSGATSTHTGTFSKAWMMGLIPTLMALSRKSTPQMSLMFMTKQILLPGCLCVWNLGKIQVGYANFRRLSAKLAMLTDFL